jgi:hypothetical protein
MHVCMFAQAFAEQADKVVNETQAQVDFMGECFYQEEFARRLQMKFPRTVNDTDGWDEASFLFLLCIFPLLLSDVHASTYVTCTCKKLRTFLEKPLVDGRMCRENLSAFVYSLHFAFPSMPFSDMVKIACQNPLWRINGQICSALL